MNLYIFNESTRSGVYGIGTYIRELTAALRHSNINVCVVNLGADNPKIQTEEKDGIEYWSFPAPISIQHTLVRGKIKELYYRNVVSLLQLRIENKRNLIFHLNFSYHDKLAEELRMVFDCKIITAIHYMDWCLDLSGNEKRFKKILYKKEDYDDKLVKSINDSYLKEKAFFENLDHIICLSENMKQILQNDYQVKPNKITVIYNGLRDINSTSDIPALRKKYHIPDIPIIFFAGRLDDVKGLSFALRAFKIVLGTLPHCHFIIAGNGLFEIYMKECEDIWMHVTFTGLIDKDKLYDLYSIADIGVMPSFHEQCSYVAIEMMMHGVPLIASTTTGLCEMVEDGITGLHIPVEEHSDKMEINTDLLAEKMIYLLQHSVEAKKMGQNGRKRYLEKYSSEVFCKNMLQLYKSSGFQKKTGEMVKYIHDERVHNLNDPDIIVPVLIKALNPQSVIDVGCGIGTFLNVFEKSGITDIMGLDGNWVDKEKLSKNISLEKYQVIDLEKGFSLNRKFDMAICLEVLEHIDVSFADVAIESLTKLSDIIVFSAAIPQQGGQNHVNEQWFGYWETKFRKYNYTFHDVLRPVFWNNINLAWWYKQNMFLVTNDSALVDMSGFEKLADKNIKNYVHPDLFSSITRRMTDYRRYYIACMNLCKNSE